MDHSIRVAEALPERLAHWHTRDILAGHRVHQSKLIDIDGHRARRVASTEIVKSMKGVGTELDAGTSLAQLGCALEHEAAKALGCETKCCGKPANAASGNQNRLIPWHDAILP